MYQLLLWVIRTALSPLFRWLCGTSLVPSQPDPSALDQVKRKRGTWQRRSSWSPENFRLVSGVKSAKGSPLLQGEFYGRQVWVHTDKKFSRQESKQDFSFDKDSNPNSADKRYCNQAVQHGLKSSKKSKKGVQAKWKDGSPVESGLIQAIEHFSRLQDPDEGFWPGDYGGPMFLLPGLVISGFVCQLDLGQARNDGMIAYLRNHQNIDGGWGTHIESPSTMFGSVLNYVALRLLGVEASDPAAEAGRRFILAYGGALETSSWAKFYLCMLGCFDWKGINSIPPECWLLPYWFPFHPGRMWCHARMVYLPMSYIYGMRFVAQDNATGVVAQLRKELYTQPYHEIKWHSVRNNCSVLDVYSPQTRVMQIFNYALTWYESCLVWEPTGILRWLRWKGCTFAINYIHAEDEQTNYVDIGPVNKVLNMASVWFEGKQKVVDGVSEEQAWKAFNKHVPRLDDYIWVAEDGIKMNGYNGSQLWDTSFALQALTEAHEALSSCGPVTIRLIRSTIVNGHTYIKNTQVKEDPPQMQAFFRHMSKGAWPFSTIDHGWPISDCTAEGLKVALQAGYGYHCNNGSPLVEPQDVIPQIRLQESVDVLLSLQNDHGGWATYEKNRGWSWYEHLNPSEVFSDIMIDYSYVECSSASLQSLAAFSSVFPSYRATDISIAIDKGANFIRSIQRDDGSWYGSWAICFCYGTWFGVQALCSLLELNCKAENVTFKADEARVLRACDFLIGKQRADGGWSESYRSCEEKQYVESDENLPAHAVSTSWALLALLKASSCVPATQNVSASIQRGIQCLLDLQIKEGVFQGEWPQQTISGVFNKTCGITYTAYRNVFPIWALSRYLIHKQEVAVPVGRQA